MKASIYEITNLETGETYIGAANQVFGRWRLHCTKLFTGKHFNKKLQESFDKHGIGAFKFQILEYEIDADKSNERELFWIGQRGSLNINEKSTRQLKNEKYWRIMGDLRKGMTYREIAELRGVSLGVITNIKRKFEQMC